MPLKKSELYASIWKSCDELRGGMDASQYKDYVLVLLFVKYVSDKYAGQKDALLDVPRGGGFADMIAAKGDKDIGEKLNTIIAKLAEANNLRGVIDVADFNDVDKLGKGKEMQDRLSNLIAIFQKPSLDFRGNRAEGDDLLGDAYEYLMRHFATQSGKSKGQFYTPAEVSRIMAKVIGLGKAKSSKQSIYDPTCGSGSLLLKAHDEAKSATGHNLTLYGQEMDNATSALARMNMYLHDCPTADIRKDNTLSTPLFKEGAALKTFDYVVANPPFSMKAWSNGFKPTEDEFKRFPYGLPPEKNGDYAFLLHLLASMKSTATGAVILPHGVLFRGGAEATIRREIVRRGFIKGLIGLPPNLFYGTGIPACIVVLDKENAAARRGIFMVDASKGFAKDGPKNRLRAQDIHRIVDTFTRTLEVPKYARMVPTAEIEANDFNLNLPRYIDTTEAEDLQDIDAHLRGGIPNRDIETLERYWQVFPGVRAALFEKADRAGYSRLRVSVSDVKSTIFGHAEFTAFNATVTALFKQWRKAHTSRLMSIAVGDKPKALMTTLSESLLAAFAEAPLVDAYDVYQHFMDLWETSMQDDVYLLVQEGWRAVLEGKPNTDLIPQSLVVARFFAKEQAALEALEAARDAYTRQMEEMEEEHGGDEGLLAEAKNDKGKLTKASVKTRLSDVGMDKSAKDERNLLNEMVKLFDQEAGAAKQVKDAQKALEAKVAGLYGKLSEAEIKTLVVEDKWLTRLEASVHSEWDRVSQALTGRIRELAERYEKPLPVLTGEIEVLAARVAAHLAKMGAA